MRSFGLFQSTLLIALAVGVPALAESPTTSPALPADVPEGSYVQGTDPAVYFVQGGYKHLVKDGRSRMHIQSPSPYKLLQITDEELAQIPTGPDVALPLPDGSYVKGLGPAIYFVLGGRKYWIPDVPTLQLVQHADSPTFTPIDEDELSKIPAGFDFPYMASDPVKQFQAFADQCAPDSATVAKVADLVAALKGGDFRSRSRVEKELDSLGKPGIVALSRLDRHGLTAEQNARIDKLIAPYQPIPADDAQTLRADLWFLLGCLFSDEIPVRKAALSQLQSKVKPKLNFDPAADPATRTIAIVALLQELIDAKVIPAKTTPQQPASSGDGPVDANVPLTAH